MFTWSIKYVTDQFIHAAINKCDLWNKIDLNNLIPIVVQIGKIFRIGEILD